MPNTVERFIEIQEHGCYALSSVNGHGTGPFVYAFGNNLSPKNLLTLCTCKNDFVHNLMSNALLLITQQRQRRKTQSNRSVCACVCYTEACATVCVRAYCRIRWQLSRKSKLSTLLSQGILCFDQGPIIVKKSLLLAAEKPNTERWYLPRSLRSVAWIKR